MDAFHFISFPLARYTSFHRSNDIQYNRCCLPRICRLQDRMSFLFRCPPTYLPTQLPTVPTYLLYTLRFHTMVYPSPPRTRNRTVRPVATRTRSQTYLTSHYHGEKTITKHSTSAFLTVDGVQGKTGQTLDDIRHDRTRQDTTGHDRAGQDGAFQAGTSLGIRTRLGRLSSRPDWV
jgi:hypothetical protein